MWSTWWKWWRISDRNIYLVPRNIKPPPWEERYNLIKWIYCFVLSMMSCSTRSKLCSMLVLVESRNFASNFSASLSTWRIEARLSSRSSEGPGSRRVDMVEAIVKVETWRVSSRDAFNSFPHPHRTCVCTSTKLTEILIKLTEFVFAAKPNSECSFLFPWSTSLQLPNHCVSANYQIILGAC